MLPKVSVIIPTYNRSHMITRAVESVLNQTYPEFEIIIVDDASTDSTYDVIRSINDSRVKVIRHERNMGGSRSRNTAIEASSGEYIALLDDDDEWLPEKLRKQVDVFRESSAETGLVYSGFSFISSKDNSVLKGIVPQKKGDLFRDFLNRDIICASTSVIKKDCFKKAGNFDETLSSCQDWDMWIRITRHYRVDFSGDILANVYIHGDQISTNLDSKISSRETLLKKYFNYLSEHPPILAFHYRRLGIMNCLANNRIRAFSCFLKSLRLIPFQKGVYIYIASLLIKSGIRNKYLKKNNITMIGDIELYY